MAQSLLLANSAADHPRQAEYQDAWDRLVPGSGKCDTLAGEFLRAVSRIGHDYTCNGFGNNWSGALNFLDEHLGVPASIRKLLGKYRLGRTVKSFPGMYEDRDPIVLAIDRLTERVLDAIPSSLVDNPGDLFDLQERSKNGW